MSIEEIIKKIVEYNNDNQYKTSIELFRKCYSISDIVDVVKDEFIGELFETFDELKTTYIYWNYDHLNSEKVYIGEYDVKDEELDGKYLTLECEGLEYYLILEKFL